MYVSLCFDVEDYTTPEEYGIDEIPKWLAEIMTEEGVTGTFLVIGNKARSLRERGRKDVIQAMARHEIGLHTNFGSHHPTACEAVQDLDFTEAVKLLAAKRRG
jgi:peptidoglycan/xylan/chitin deacetylase (PgdA/CDA1 family)